MIDANALMEYCNNLKVKKIDANDIARFPTAVGWINVKDRLPEKTGDYLIFNTDGAVWIYWYDEEYKEWYDDNGYQTESVTHWMPLPESPKGNNKGRSI